MNIISIQKHPASMNSLQMADMIDAPHDSVKRTIRRLAKKEAIILPALTH